MPNNKDLDFATLAIAHKVLTHEQIEEAQALLSDEQARGVPPRPIEDILLEMGMIKHEEIWAVKKAQQRLLRDATNVGEKIGGYEIISKVGEGGLGVVYQARQLSMGRTVALKVLHEKWITDDEFRKRFLVEARLVGRLSHPNLIQVIDVGRHRNQLYYSMEFIDGITVEKQLDDYGKMGFAEAMDIVCQVASALEHLASKKIVHRDVKPGNIMMTTKGVAKLGDFGFVKSSLDSVLSPDGEILGTPDYISPEAANGDRDIDFRSDIYSLGVSFYHMLAGKPPFSGTSSQVLDAHIFEKAPLITEFRPDVPKFLCDIVNKMIAKKPSARYQNYADFFADMELLRRVLKPDSPEINGAVETLQKKEVEGKMRFLTILLVINSGLLLLAIGVILYLLFAG